MARLWIGVDAGKEHHHAAGIDDTGQVMWSVRVANDQAAIELIDRVVGHDAVWGIDLISSETALLRAMLTTARQATVYVPGRTVKAMAAGFVGEAKTDLLTELWRGSGSSGRQVLIGASTLAGHGRRRGRGAESVPVGGWSAWVAGAHWGSFRAVSVR